MKKVYQNPSLEVVRLEGNLLQTIIAESGTTGIKPGEGGDDLAREYDEEFED